MITEFEFSGKNVGVKVILYLLFYKKPVKV